jgi:putative PIN family toxin of toxin-antitoxin system
VIGAKRPPRVVVDTNLFVSGLIVKRGLPYQLLNSWRQGSFTLLISEEQREEIAVVLDRPAIAQRYGIAVEERAALLWLIDAIAVRVSSSHPLPLTVRDAKDEMILASALGGRADYLVTGDEDLLVLSGSAEIGSLGILRAREFVELLETSS